MVRQLISILFGCGFFLFFSVSGLTSGPIRVPKAVKDALLKQGVSRETVRNCFKGPFDRVEIGVVLKNVTHKEVMADYRRFLKKKTIQETEKYLAEHGAVFSKIEKTYQVPKEVIASILMVESSFGRNGGGYSVFSVYASLASLMDKDVRRVIKKRAARAGEDVKAKGFGRRITRKAKWGMKELLCLVRLSEQGKVDLTRLKGSWAGAFGMPQFIPTSFEAYGVDWDRDGRVDLDTLSDAAASAANYLHSHGWKKTLTRKKALRIIKFYNLSHPYATTLLKMSEKLKTNRN